MTGTDHHGLDTRLWLRPRLFLFAAVAVTLGLSDVWRFPLLLAEHASPWFPIIYLAALALIGVPLLVAEIALALLGRSRPAVNFGFRVDGTAASPLWQYSGIIVLGAVCLILSYASVVAAWTLAYGIRALGGGLDDMSTGAARLLFQSLIGDPERLLGWHTLFMVGLGWISAREPNAGVGRFSRLMVIAIFTLGALLAALSLYHFGLSPLAAVDWSGHWRTLSGALVLDALTQAFFTLGVCMGAMLILGHHLPPATRIGPLALGIVLADILFVALGTLGVLPLLLSAQTMEGGVVLAVELVPQLLAGLPLAGVALGGFYLLLFLLIASTALVLMELLVAWLSARTARPRATIAPLAAAGVWCGGVLALLSFSVLAFEFEFVGEARRFGLFDMMDILSSEILLPIFGLLMAVFVGWHIDRDTFASALGPRRAAVTLQFLKRYLVPVAMAVVFVALVFGRVLPRV